MPKNSTELFGLLSFLAILALFLHSVWRFSRRFPNASETPPTGVEGGLMLLMTASVTLTVWHAAAMASRGALFSLLASPDEGVAAKALAGLLPDALAFLGFLWTSLRVVTGRIPRVKVEGAVGLLLGGPLSQGVLYALTGTVEVSFVAGVTLFSLWGAWYLLQSDRARHVYG